MNLTALDSIASGTLGAVIVAIAWIVKHESQIKGLLNLLPSLAQDAAKARTAVENAGVGPAVTKVEAELDDEAKSLLHGLLTKLEARVTPMAEPVPAATDVPDVAPETTPAPVAAPAGLAEGAVVVVRGGQLVPQTA